MGVSVREVLIIGLTTHQNKVLSWRSATLSWFQRRSPCVSYPLFDIYISAVKNWSQGDTTLSDYPSVYGYWRMKGPWVRTCGLIWLKLASYEIATVIMSAVALTAQHLMQIHLRINISTYSHKVITYPCYLAKLCIYTVRQVLKYTSFVLTVMDEQRPKLS